MKSLFLLLVVGIVCISQSSAKDLLLGSTFNAHVIWHEKADYMAIPFKKRVKEVFYSDPSQKIIQAIVARDEDQSEASATVTAGGVGYTYVNIRLKSERGGGLHYNIQIYAV